MSSSDEYYLQLLTNIPIYLHQYVATFLYAIGNIGNLMSLAIFFKKSWRKNVCVFYFIICLLTSTVFVNSTLLGSIFTIGFKISKENSSAVICKLFYYVSYLCSTYFAIILILASIDRLLISSQNVDTRLYSSKRLAYFTLSISAFVWTIFSLHILIKTHIQQVAPFYFICYFDLSQFYVDFIAYSSVTISIIILFMMIILSIVAFRNVRRIRAIPRQQRNRVRTMNKKDFQLLQCLYIHNIVYTISSIVLAASLIYGSITARQDQTPKVKVLNSFLTILGSFLHYIPYCGSFFIFICLSKAFRQELKRFGYKLCCKDLAIAREEVNPQPEAARENIEQNNVVSTIALPH